MSVKLNFSNEGYRNSALNKKSSNYENNVTAAQAFYICINGLDFYSLDNLCIALQDYYNDGRNVYDFYLMLQDINIDDEFKQVVLDLAYKVIESEEGKNLGTGMVPNTNFNSSSWISHSLYEGKLCSILAENLNLNPDTAMKLGILHDIGRKKTHTFNHVIKGYELLVDLGLTDEAVVSLTHSFLPDIRKFKVTGNRCANCDVALDGLIVDSDMNEHFETEEDKDDITLFLEQYEYNIYDQILNISDLMAKSEGITSPLERVNDIYTRKIPDIRNQGLFLHRFVCIMNKLLFGLTKDIIYLDNINNINNEDLYNLFVETSNEFMNKYNSLIKKHYQKRI